MTETMMYLYEESQLGRLSVDEVEERKCNTS